MNPSFTLPLTKLNLLKIYSISQLLREYGSPRTFTAASLSREWISSLSLLRERESEPELEERLRSCCPLRSCRCRSSCSLYPSNSSWLMLLIYTYLRPMYIRSLRCTISAHSAGTFTTAFPENFPC